MITSSKPFPAIVSTPESTAPLRPRPGPHSTVAPSDSAHFATASSSQATNVGSGRTASMTRPAIQRASAARSAAATVGDSLALAAWNALTGISTAGSTPSLYGTLHGRDHAAR